MLQGYQYPLQTKHHKYKIFKTKLTTFNMIQNRVRVGKYTANASSNFITSLKQNHTNIWCFWIYNSTVTFWRTIFCISMLYEEKSIKPQNLLLATSLKFQKLGK